MQVTETNAEGLKRDYKVVIPASEIDENVTARLTELSKTIQLPGFRPGKAPVALLKKKYGSSVMGEILEKSVGETSRKIITDNNLSPALQPKIEVTSFEEGGDLEFTMSVEVFPEVEPADFTKIKLERQIVPVDEKEIDESLQRIAESHKSSEPVTTKRKSKSGDIVVIDFVGKIDGTEFPGGKAEDYKLELGSGSFIPGFEDQLIGAKAGDQIDVKVNFPENYGAEDLAGKEASFDVTVKGLEEPKPAEIDDELAKKLGKDNLEDLKVAIREEHGRQYKDFSRSKLKRALLDELDALHTIDLPEGLIEQELQSINAQFADYKKNNPDDDDDQSDEDRQAEFEEMAKRRVKLGIILSEVGKRNNVEVAQEDINRAMMEQARQFPGHEQQMIDFLQQNPEAMQRLTAPIFEDKVIDSILESTTITDKEVTAEELLKQEEENEAKASKKKPAAKKKAAPKKKEAAKSDDDKGEEKPKAAPKKKPAAKKPAAKKAASKDED